MRVLWLSNVMLPDVAKHLHKPIPSCGGWLSGALEELKHRKDIQLATAFPLIGENKILSDVADEILYYGFPGKNSDPTKYDAALENIFESMILEFKPDVIHIWGTEFPHTLSMVKACCKLGQQEKIVISIQGLCSVIARHYYANLPWNVIKRYTFRDIIFRDSIYRQKLKFEKRGLYEREALSLVKHVIGRTTWDRTCTLQINPDRTYHFCNETLRNSFYENQWEYENCEKHSIFISQAYYPVKGAHSMLEALALIITKYPDARLYIADSDLLRADSWRMRLKRTSYARYLGELIKKYKLQGRVFFTGSLSEEQMCQRFLKSHVFVCPSSIENSPNSLGEAMTLGVPCVASCVGGISDMLQHEKEGFLYQADAPYMLAQYVCELFEHQKLALSFSQNARERARQTHDREKNLNHLINIYDGIFGVQEETERENG